MRFIRGDYAEVDEYDELLKQVLARVGEFLQAMREGRFDMMPTHDCPGFCPFRQICHFSPARDEVKRPPEEVEDVTTAQKSELPATLTTKPETPATDDKNAADPSAKGDKTHKQRRRGGTGK